MYHGGEWHRAEVLNTKPNPNSDEIDVYYVDYGDSDYVKLEGIRKLDIEFYSLPFQAIECSLSDIQINDTNNSDKFEWSEADLSLFEDLVYSCKWKKLKLEFVEKKDSLYNHNKKVLCKLYDESKVNYFIEYLRFLSIFFLNFPFNRMLMYRICSFKIKTAAQN
jgi:hypothetical protein